MIKKINNNDREFATSNCLAVYEFFQDGAPIFCHENLYRTTSGSYFLKVETGPDSFYHPTNLVCGIMSKLSSHCQKPKLRLGQNENFLSWTTARFLVLLRKVKHLYQFSLLKGKIL